MKSASRSGCWFHPVRLAAVAAVLVAVGLARAAAHRIDAAIPAPNPAFQATSFTLEGKISERKSGKLTVSTEENIVFHVNYGAKSEIKRHDGSQGSEKDLRVGVRIKVEGDLAESGEIESRKIEIESEAASGRQ